MAGVFVPNEQGWAEIAKLFVQTEITRRMKAIADACNAADGLQDGYELGTEGDGPQLQKRDFRQTVITATAPAIELNAKHGTLERHFHMVSGA